MEAELMWAGIPLLAHPANLSSVFKGTLTHLRYLLHLLHDFGLLIRFGEYLPGLDILFLLLYYLLGLLCGIIHQSIWM